MKTWQDCKIQMSIRTKVVSACLSKTTNCVAIRSRTLKVPRGESWPGCLFGKMMSSRLGWCGSCEASDGTLPCVEMSTFRRYYSMAVERRANPDRSKPFPRRGFHKSRAMEAFPCEYYDKGREGISKPMMGKIVERRIES